MASAPQLKRHERRVLKFDTEEDVAVALAQYVADLSEKYITQKGSFSVVLSGGTLIDTLRVLVDSYKDSVDWSKWLIFWVDERVVPLDNKDSNYLLAWNGFLSKLPEIPKDNIYPIHYSHLPKDVAEEYEARLKKLVLHRIIPLSASGFPKFDLMLLGVGPDGHVASLFPNRPQQYEMVKWVTYITDSPKPPPPRITFTFPVIDSADYIAVVVTDKAEAHAVAMALKEPPNMPPLPCAKVRAEKVVTWFLDKDAASELPP